MKIVIYGKGSVPELPEIHCLARTEIELYRCMYELSGGELVVVVLARDYEDSALRAAAIAQPPPTIVRYGQGRFFKRTPSGSYRLYQFPDN